MVVKTIIINCTVIFVALDKTDEKQEIIIRQNRAFINLI